MNAKTSICGPSWRVIALAGCLLAPAVMAAPLTDAQALELVKQEEANSSSTGDLTLVGDFKVEHAGSPDYIVEMLTYRRDTKDQLMLLLTKPKIQAGKGYLMEDLNIWYYDPTVGRWQRETERDRIGGTNARRQDLAARRDSQLYTVKYEREEKLGKRPCHVMKLTAKPGVNVAYPILEYWMDAQHPYLNQVKTYSASGKLLQTVLMPKWSLTKDSTTNKPFWFWSEMHIYDEVEKGFVTHISIKHLDTKPLPDATFTKAWLESKSR
jgi:hypothetical protein